MRRSSVYGLRRIGAIHRAGGRPEVSRKANGRRRILPCPFLNEFKTNNSLSKINWGKGLLRKNLGFSLSSAEQFGRRGVTVPTYFVGTPEGEPLVPLMGSETEQSEASDAGVVQW